MSAVSPFRDELDPAEALEAFEAFENVSFATEDGPFVAFSEAEQWAEPEWQEEPEWKAVADREDEYEYDEGEGFGEFGEDEDEDDEELLAFAEAEAEEEAEDEAAHPILALFALPKAVLDALGSGMWSLGIGLAAGAGYRDENQLTNIVFYFRNPHVIGRKIRPDEKALAAEWISIRDKIVRPAVASMSAGAQPGAAAPSTPVTPPTVVTPAGTGGSIPSTGLQWPGAGANADKLAFMKAVYDSHVRRSQKAGGTFIGDLPRTAVGPIIGRHEARKDAAAAARALLDAANAKLRAEGKADRIVIGVVSAYRPATQQFGIWQKNFPKYFDQLIKNRRLTPGDYGPKAIATMTEKIAKRVAAPGYSNHQAGRAIDFGMGSVGGKDFGVLKEGGWFHDWLVANAHLFGFTPYTEEAWHWNFGAPATAPPARAPQRTPTAPAPKPTTPTRGAGDRVSAGRDEIPRVPLLKSHRGNPPDVILHWNDMPSVPAEIDVVVHLHGFSKAKLLNLRADKEGMSGLDLVPPAGASGPGRSRPTLAVLPRGNATGVLNASGYYGYTFDALVAPGALSKLVQVALVRFAALHRGAVPRIGRLILTAHSGGGAPLMQILGHPDLDPHEVHVYDGLYQDPTALVEWARKRIRRDRAGLLAAAASPHSYMASQGGAMRVFYLGRKPTLNSRRVEEKLAPDLGSGLERWYRAEKTTVGHDAQPGAYGWRLLADASADVPGASREPLTQPEVDFEDSLFEDVQTQEDLEGQDEADPLGLSDEWPADEVYESEWDEGAEYDEWGEAYDEGEPAAEDAFWELEEEDTESAEVELGEAEELFFEDLFAGEPAFEDETPEATVPFPSGETLTVVSGPTGKYQEHYDPTPPAPSGKLRPLLDTGPAVRSKRLSDSFTVGELARSGPKTFDKARIDPALVGALQRLRDHLDKPVHVRSGYRSYAYNIEVYKEISRREGREVKPTLSRHSGGQAADVNVAGMTGMQIAKAAIDALGTEIGVGIANSYAHIDVRGKWAKWTYYRKGSPQDLRARAEIEAYRRQRKGSVPSRPSTPAAPSPTRPPATGATPAVRMRRVKQGWAAYGGGRLDAALRKLVQAGALKISERDIDTLQRIADTESSGLANALNTWDSAIVSIGFKQWTLMWGELQDLIARAPEAFARHGIRLAPEGTNYVFSSKGKTWPQRAISGAPDKQTLRNEDWSRRFYLAGLEPEAIAAAARKALEDVAKLERSVRAKYGWSPHFDSPRGRALLVELDNNRPAYVKTAVPRTLQRAALVPAIGEDAFLALFVAEIVSVYEQKEKDAEKGRRWTRKIMRR